VVGLDPDHGMWCSRASAASYRNAISTARADQCRKSFIAIAAILFGYGLFLDRVLDFIGTFPILRAPAVLLRAYLPARLPDGLPDATAMTTLARLEKHHIFLWAWASTAASRSSAPRSCRSWRLVGLTAVLMAAGLAYLAADPGVSLPYFCR